MFLQNYFLLAMPSVVDSTFGHSLIYVCAHNAEGSMGVIVNHPLAGIALGEVLEQMNITAKTQELADSLVYFGGPVQPERGFVIHRLTKRWQSTFLTGDDLGVTSSQDILHAIASGSGPKDVLVTLGYAGWGAGQLEKEVADNLWLTVLAEPRILFETPYDQRRNEAALLLGVDLAHLTDQSGHA